MADKPARKDIRQTFGRLLGKTSIYPSTEAVIAAIKERQSQGPVSLGFVNAHAYNLCCNRPDFLQAVESLDVVLRDGIGVKMLYALSGRPAGANLNGTDLIPQLLTQVFARQRALLLGSTDEELSAAAQEARALGVDVVATQHGFAELDEYVALIASTQPDVVVLGMGMPKQELLAQRIGDAGLSVSVICGGAILDFLAGKVSRAPQWMRLIGAEWLFRLIQEPRRLFRRYVIGNYLFLARALSYNMRRAT